MDEREGLAEQLKAVFGGQNVERIGDDAFVPLLRLESDIRYGIDEQGVWCLHSEGEESLRRLSEATAYWFIEWVEHPRQHIEGLLEKAAEVHGFDADELVGSVPVVDLVAGLLASRSLHACRLALTWPRPTELRPLRGILKALADDRGLPDQIRQLASHMVVSE